MSEPRLMRVLNWVVAVAAAVYAAAMLALFLGLVPGPLAPPDRMMAALVFLGVGWALVDSFWQSREEYLRQQRLRWDRAGRCRHCGYDLRASSARCPECEKEAPVREP